MTKWIGPSTLLGMTAELSIHLRLRFTTLENDIIGQKNTIAQNDINGQNNIIAQNNIMRRKDDRYNFYNFSHI